MRNIALILAALLLPAGIAAGAAKHHAKSAQHGASASKFAKVCAETWPRYLAAVQQEGVDDFDETLSPAEVERDHRAFIANFNANGVSSDAKYLIREFGK